MAKSKTVREAARETKVAGICDVVITGGGVAGVAAAVAAARLGAKTLLVENHCVLGGLATEGMVAIYLPICDGRGRQVIAGLGEEMLRLTSRHAPALIPECWLGKGTTEQRTKERYLSRFGPHAYMIALEEFALGEGVEIWYDTRVCDAAMKGDRIEALIVESKSGREAICAKVFVDASGDADLCARAGQPTVTHHDNARAGWFYAAGAHGVQLVQNHMSFTDPKPGEPLFGGDTREDVNAMLQKSRPLVMERVRKLRAERNDPDLYPVLIGTIPQFRLTRRMASAVEVDESHNHQWFDDAVTLAGDWREAGPVYAIPYRSLVANERSNLLAAGRCTSSTRSGAEVTRAIPICVATGEAAGTAAAMGCRGEVDLRRMDVTELQGQLLKQGVILDRGLVEA